MFEEDWHSIPEHSTEQVAKIYGPVVAISEKIGKIQEAEQMKLRAMRAQRNSTGAAACKGKIDAYRSTRRLLSRLDGTEDSMVRVQALILQQAQIARKQARFAMFQKRVDLRAKSVTLAKLSKFVSQEAELLERQLASQGSQGTSRRDSQRRSSQRSTVSYKRTS